MASNGNLRQRRKTKTKELEVNKDTIEILSREFAPNQIKVLKKAGRGFDYIEQASCIRRLNEAFGLNWSFEVFETAKASSAIVVKGRLIVPIEDGKMIVKEQFGHATLHNKMDLGDSYKTAASDALKKCATLLGVALHLYEDDDEVKVTGETKPRNRL
jgi:hypothetical protein